MIRRILILSFLVVFSTSIFAQKKRSTKKRSDDVEIIEFEDDTPRKRKRKKKKKETAFSGMIIKTNPLSNIVGWQFVEAEYPLLDFLSVQAGVGLTFQPVVQPYGNLLIELLTENTPPSEQWGEYDIQDDYTDLSIRTSSPGAYLSGSGRLFFYDDAPSGSFVSFKARYSTRNMKVQKISEGAQSITRLPDQLEKETLRNFDFMIGYGYQELYSRLTVSYFGAVGYRIKNDTRQDIGTDENSRFYNGTRKIQQNTFRYEFGIRIGYQL